MIILELQRIFGLHFSHEIIVYVHLSLFLCPIALNISIYLIALNNIILFMAIIFDYLSNQLDPRESSN